MTDAGPVTAHLGTAAGDAATAPRDAAAWSRVARTVVRTPYPWSPGHTVLGPEDAHLVPEELHPAFHGSLDWHSCVHAYWMLAHLLRRFYREFDQSPAMRPLVNYVKRELGPDKGNSLYLLQLFPGSPAKLAARIAGLPRPEHCL